MPLIVHICYWHHRGMVLSGDFIFSAINQSYWIYEYVLLFDSKRLYDVNMNQMKQSYKHSMSVLDCCFNDANRVYSGGLDKTLKMYDFTAQKEFDIGTHNEAIRCVHYLSSLNLIITGSWDNYVKIWDPRMSAAVSTLDQQKKVCFKPSIIL